MSSIFSGLRFSADNSEKQGNGGLYWGVRTYKLILRQSRHFTLVKNEVKPFLKKFRE